GGDVFLTSGDHINVTKSITADSNSGGGLGGSITLDAGEDALGGTVVGGQVTIDSTRVSAHGSALGCYGGDGGRMGMTAFGAILVTDTATLRVNADSSYDGFGGTITIDSSDGNDTAIGPFDGDLTLNGAISALGGHTGGYGGFVALFAGRALIIGGAITATGGDSVGEVG